MDMFVSGPTYYRYDTTHIQVTFNLPLCLVELLSIQPMCQLLYPFEWLVYYTCSQLSSIGWCTGNEAGTVCPRGVKIELPRTQELRFQLAPMDTQGWDEGSLCFACIQLHAYLRAMQNLSLNHYSFHMKAVFCLCCQSSY